MRSHDDQAARPATLRVKDLARTYRTGGTPVAAVQGVDLSVEPGEFVAVMGPSGSGKSTLLRMLGGLDTPTRGEIWLRGQRVDALNERDWAILRRRRIGFIFQTFNLISNMTVADNVELPAMLAGASPREARGRRRFLLDELGIGDKAAATPVHLSGGEQQLVAMARALANEPSLLLADEPTGNLDSGTTRTVMNLLREIHDRGQTMLLVTHEARIASMADRVVTLLDGMIVDDAAVSAPSAPDTTVRSIFDRLG
jgi:putative ABC transport system ATP-binding protein